MKLMIFTLGFLSLIGDDRYRKLKNFSLTEKSFIKHVIDTQDEEPMSILRRDDDHILIIFPKTKIVLKPNGFLGEMWIRDSPKTKWYSLGTEY